jgi:hypothetical protein
VLGSDRDLAFVAFWDRCPRKESKGQARKAWASARRRGVPAEVMIRAMERYRDDPNRRPKYTRLPATWINAEGWTDDPQPPEQPEQPRTTMGKNIAVLRNIAANGRAGAPQLGPGS